MNVDMKKLSDRIYDSSNTNFLLGALMNKPSLCTDNKYPIDKDDFTPILFHRIVFASVYNLSLNGVKDCDEIVIRDFLSNYQSQLTVFEDNKGMEFVATVKELSNANNYEYYYDILRKYSVVRDAYKDGEDVSQFWDFELDDSENMENMSKYSLKDVLDYYETKNVKRKKKYLVNSGTERMTVGDGFDIVLNNLEESPMVGAGLASPMLNSLYRGLNGGHLILRGAPSGIGKTTMSIADLCNMSCKKIWSNKHNDFIDNPSYQGKGYFIHTEQKMKTEIQPRFISTVSGIPYHIILDGKFNSDQKERLLETARITKDSEVELLNQPTFTASSLENTIREMALEGYHYGVFDYIWASGYAMAEFRKNMGGGQREDQLTLHLANILKISAEETNTGIMTMIQLNGKEKDLDIVDESCLFGGRSVKTKLDNGSIYMPPKPKELELVEDLIAKWNRENKSDEDRFGKQIVPNAISHVFKARYGRYGMNIKVWHYVDNSIGSITDMFATKSDNTPIDIPKLIIKNK